jgi:hypothetical protein
MSDLHASLIFIVPMALFVFIIVFSHIRGALK